MEKKTYLKTQCKVLLSLVRKIKEILCSTQYVICRFVYIVYSFLKLTSDRKRKKQFNILFSIFSSMPSSYFISTFMRSIQFICRIIHIFRVLIRVLFKKIVIYKNPYQNYNLLSAGISHTRCCNQYLLCVAVNERKIICSSFL